MSKIIEVSDNDFESSVINSSLQHLVLLKFWGSWCQPCKRMEPVFSSLLESYGDKIKIFSLNIENNTIITNKFNIRSIPATLIFKEKNLIAQHSGFLPESKLIPIINKYIV